MRSRGVIVCAMCLAATLADGCTGFLGPVSAATVPLTGSYDGPISPVSGDVVSPVWHNPNPHGTNDTDGVFPFLFKYISLFGSTQFGYGSAGTYSGRVGYAEGGILVRTPSPIGVFAFGLTGGMSWSYAKVGLESQGMGGRVSYAPMGPGPLSIDLDVRKITANLNDNSVRDLSGWLVSPGVSLLLWGTSAFRFGVQAFYRLQLVDGYPQRGPTFALSWSFY